MLDPNVIASMIFTLLLASLVGGFILLYPLSRRLGELLEEKIRDQKTRAIPSSDDLQELRELVQSLEAEIGMVAERQRFTEQLLAQREADALPGADREGFRDSIPPNRERR